LIKLAGVLVAVPDLGIVPFATFLVKHVVATSFLDDHVDAVLDVDFAPDVGQLPPISLIYITYHPVNFLFRKWNRFVGAVRTRTIPTRVFNPTGAAAAADFAEIASFGYALVIKPGRVRAR